MKKAPRAIEAAIGEKTEMSYAEVRALISIAIDKGPRQPELPAAETADVVPSMGHPALPSSPPAPTIGASEVQLELVEAQTEARLMGDRGTRAPISLGDRSAPPAASNEPSQLEADSVPPRKAPQFTVKAGKRKSILITARASDTEGHALVQFGDAIEDVPLPGLRLVAVEVAL